jgi:hypothetical protein
MLIVSCVASTEPSGVGGGTAPSRDAQCKPPRHLAAIDVQWDQYVNSVTTYWFLPLLAFLTMEFTMRQPLVSLDVIEQAAGPMDTPEMESLESILETQGCDTDRIADVLILSPFESCSRLESQLGYPLAFDQQYVVG